MLVLSPVELPSTSTTNSDAQIQVKHLEPNTTVYHGNTQFGTGEGTLSITTEKLIWRSDTDGQGFTLAYPEISLHAISKDLSNFHSECLYLMLDDGNEADHESGDDDSIPAINELRFIPRDLTKLDPMYRALCVCQLLHPDPQDSVSSEDGDEFFGLEGDEGDNGDDSGHNGEGMEVTDGQFDDAALI